MGLLLGFLFGGPVNTWLILEIFVDYSVFFKNGEEQRKEEIAGFYF